MLLNINFFRESGKWYSGGVVKVAHQLYDMDELKQDIVNNQEILNDGWQGEFDVMVEAVNDDNFCTHLFHRDKFSNVSKTK